jgi:hypothetical protein
MATAKKLPGGSYRVRVYDNDSKKYKSFTAPNKKLAKLAVSPTCVWLFHEMFCWTGNAVFIALRFKPLSLFDRAITVLGST